MRSKTNTNRTLHARFFPRFEQVTSKCYEFSLVHPAFRYPLNSTTHLLHRLREIKQPIKYARPASLARVHVFRLLSHPSQKFETSAVYLLHIRGQKCIIPYHHSCASWVQTCWIFLPHALRRAPADTDSKRKKINELFNNVTVKPAWRKLIKYRGKNTFSKPVWRKRNTWSRRHVFLHRNTLAVQ